jgi:hypothetical protein
MIDRGADLLWFQAAGSNGCALLSRLARRIGGILEALGLRLLKIEPYLPQFGCLRRVGSGLQIGFFHKVTPTRTAVFLALTPFEIVESSLCALGSFYDGHNTTRDVGLLVEPNNREGTIRLVCHFDFPS